MLFPTVARRHEELFDEIELRMSIGLRPTPALSQAEMARVLDVTYDAFRGDVRGGRWQAVAEDRVRNGTADAGSTRYPNSTRRHSSGFGGGCPSGFGPICRSRRARRSLAFGDLIR